MAKNKLLIAGLFLVLPIAILIVLLQPSEGTPVARSYFNECATCHTVEATKMTSGLHKTLQCEQCHEGADSHLAEPTNAAMNPKVHFDKESCMGCHPDQYNSFLIVDGGKTFYGGSDGGAHAPKGWSKTFDLPYWNVLIDGHPFVLETYEDRPMALNQIEHQETIRPGSESCMACHGTKLAYYMGIQYKDATGIVKYDGMDDLGNGAFAPREVLIKGGTYIPPAETDPQYPLGGTWNNPASTPGTGHLIYDGTSYKNPADEAWEEAVTVIFIPNGTVMSTYIDALDPAFPYQVKTLITLPAPVTVSVPDVANLGAPIQTITFQTVSSYPESGADINGVTGCTVITANCPSSQGVANVARNWAYAAMEAMAFDGLDYEFDPLEENPETVGLLASGYYGTHFSGKGENWPSIQSGQLCNQCHDPMSTQPRIIKKSLIESIATRGINPYTQAKVYDFNQATRQDKIIAQCAQCHSEYVGGYSANDGRDRDYFPWAKPLELETLYWNLFDYLQDWTHGGPIPPWQSVESNARGFTPYGQRYPINAPLVKVQHPEAEEYLNSPMYIAGATCTDCHSARITRPDGSRYTSHWFVSPLKIMAGYNGTTFMGNNIPGDPISMAAQNPCQKCHTTDTIAQSQQRIKGQQDVFYVLQERTQVALVNALKFISEQPAGAAREANIKTYQRASMRWEYFTQAENSMSFHNNPEATTEVSNARLWVDAFIPWPLTPVSARIASAGPDTLTLVFFDQASDETGFIVERGLAVDGPYTQVADIPTPNGVNIGDVQFTDVGLASGTTYFYRVAAYSAAGTSVYSIWASGATQGVAVGVPSALTATPFSSSQIDLTWVDNASNETGFRLERARDAAFTKEFVTFNIPANVAAYSDTGLLPETTYYYRLFALGAGGTSAASNTSSVTTLAAPPAAPTSLVVLSTSQTSIKIGWKDNAGNEQGFYVERCATSCTSSGAIWTSISTLSPNTVSFTDTGLARRKTYWYRVQSFNLVGVSTYTNVVSAKTR